MLWTYPIQCVIILVINKLDFHFAVDQFFWLHTELGSTPPLTYRQCKLQKNIEGKFKFSHVTGPAFYDTAHGPDFFPAEAIKAAR